MVHTARLRLLSVEVGTWCGQPLNSGMHVVLCKSTRHVLNTAKRDGDLLVVMGVAAELRSSRMDRGGEWWYSSVVKKTQRVCGG